MQTYRPGEAQGLVILRSDVDKCWLDSLFDVGGANKKK